MQIVQPVGFGKVVKANHDDRQPQDYSLFQLALLILHDACPPDPTKYLCEMGEECENDCERCWEKYLFWAVNGYKGDPYKWDKAIEGREG